MPVGRPPSPEPFHHTTVRIPRGLMDFFSGLRLSQTEGRIKYGFNALVVDLLHRERSRLEAQAQAMGKTAVELTAEEMADE